MAGIFFGMFIFAENVHLLILFISGQHFLKFKEEQVLFRIGSYGAKNSTVFGFSKLKKTFEMKAFVACVLKIDLFYVGSNS